MSTSTTCLNCLYSALLLVAFARCGSSVGFCLDNIPLALEGTGYTAVSDIRSEAECSSAGHDWCPLSAEQRTYEHEDEGTGRTATIDYYWWSACCTGRQGRQLIADETGLPTCLTGKSATQCSRHDWQNKLYEDLIGEDSGYNFKVSPAQTPMDPRTYGGYPGGNNSVACTCSAEDPDCVEVGTNGDTCLVCETNRPCSPEAKVEMSISFFKITSVDLRSSELQFSAWMRQIWTDPRLSYDYQCYGGMDYIEFTGTAGNLENSEIWTPDIELYNHKESIWGDGTLGARLAQVYSCWDGAPSRGGCGYIFWSRPGVFTALCRYTGLINFPNDDLSCELEFSGWAIDGRFQDLVPRAADGGVNWVDKPVEEGQTKSLTGLTSGSSFQDYRIKTAEIVRKVAFYDCCPNSPYPALLYRLQFKRSTDYYTFKLVIPSVVLTLLSFITFFMSPDTGERLGFGITMILAMLASDITASSMMPVCNEKTFMDYLSQVCMLFGCISLLETGVVMFLFHQHTDSWSEALSPSGFYRFIKCHHCRKAMRATPLQKSVVRLDMSDEEKLRHQLFSQIFFVLDTDYGGSLDASEIAHFGEYALGMNWSTDLAMEFMEKYDKNHDHSLSIDEFALFCQEFIYAGKSVEFIEKRAKGFLEVVDRKENMRKDMWHSRAHTVDVLARWTIPSGFLIVIAVLYQLGEENLMNLAFDENASRWQFSIYLSGMLPMSCLLLCTCAMSVCSGYSKVRRSMTLIPANDDESSVVPDIAAQEDGTSGEHKATSDDAISMDGSMLSDPTPKHTKNSRGLKPPPSIRTLSEKVTAHQARASPRKMAVP